MQSLSSQEPVGLLIGAVRRRVKQAVGNRARPYGLSPQQFWMLVGVAEHRGASLSELAGRLRVDTPTASRVVATLVKRGLVRVTGDPDDRRRCRLDPTARGTALARRLQPVAAEMRGALVAGLTPTEHETLRRLLRRVIANLDRLERLEEGVA